MIYKIFLMLKKVFRSVQNLGILIGNTSTLNYFRPKEILMRISKTAIAVFPHPFANLMGGIEVYRVDAAGCGTENSYLLHKGY